jgi:site-specific DNA recombinase
MNKPAAIYARVSTNHQREEETIASQTAALKTYAEANHYLVPAAWVFEDDGYRGATLVRPGLEALRDLAAAGDIEAVIVYSPDRLSRKFAYQILLTEEFTRCGVSVVYVKSRPEETPEDRLLVQVPGMIAEYERTQIVERTRRGKRHKAQRGLVNVLSGAPYGYRYVKKSEHADAPYIVDEAEAAIVREVFKAYTQEGQSLITIARRFNQQQVPARKGGWWEPATLRKMLRNPAYRGAACFGKTALRPCQRFTRRTRLKGRLPVRDSSYAERPQSEWLEIAVPPLITPEVFGLAQERLQENKHFARRRTITPTLLAGLLVCEHCGYSVYRRRDYYRCFGTDSWRHAHGRVCTMRPIRQGHLDALVWSEVIRLLDDPMLVEAELQRRRDAARQSNPNRQRVEELSRQQSRLTHSMERLVTAYQDELVTLEELRERMPLLRKQQQTIAAEMNALELAAADQASYLRISDTLADFRNRLRRRANTLDTLERQTIVRLLIKEIHVGANSLTIRHILRTPGPHQGGPQRWSPSETPGRMLSDGLLSVRSRGAVH